MATIKKVLIAITLSFVAFGVQSQNIKQDIQRQKQQQEERDMQEFFRTMDNLWEIYKDSDKYKIEESIAKDFNEWNRKGEFETTMAYEERLKKQSVQKFYQICEEKVTDFFERIRISDVELLQYNADDQYFLVEINFQNVTNTHYYIVPVSIEEAPKFKADFKSYDWKKSKVYNMAFVDCTPRQRCPFLAPTKVSYDGIEYMLYDESGCSKVVEFNYNYLNYVSISNNPYCADAVWNINMIKLAEEKRIAEQRRMDSIACIKYNRELDSIVTAYNQKLLQEEYNYDKKTVKSHNLECGQGIEKRFNDAMNEINNSFKSIMALAEAEKQRIQDSIACIEYNKQLDSIVTAYNQKLLQEEYNFDKKTIKFLPLEIGERKGYEIEKWFNEEQKRINEKYNTIIKDADNSRRIVQNYKRDNYEELENFKLGNAYYYCPNSIKTNIYFPREKGIGMRNYSDGLIEKLIEVTVDMCTWLSNEWAKNGQYFESKVEFFDSFILYRSGDHAIAINPEYKTILKERKQNNKNK